MIRSAFPAITVTAAILISACTQGDEVERRDRYDYTGITQFETVQPVPMQPSLGPAPGDFDTPQPPAPPLEVAPMQPAPAPPPPPTGQTGASPYGVPVPAKPGFVTSPHAPYSGYVDVRGYPPGTEVKDPYTGKIFLVP